MSHFCEFSKKNGNDYRDIFGQILPLKNETDSDAVFTQCGKTRNSLPLEKIFHEINSLVMSLSKTLPSQNLYQKSMRVNFRSFHTVWPSTYTVFRSFPKGRIKLLILQRTFSTSCWPLWFGQKAQQGSWKKKKEKFCNSREGVCNFHPFAA